VTSSVAGYPVARVFVLNPTPALSPLSSMNSTPAGASRPLLRPRPATLTEP
jgi:hypothetical protein